MGLGRGYIAPSPAILALSGNDMGGDYQGLGGASHEATYTFRHSSMEGIAIIICSMVDEHLTIKVICC